MLTELIIGSLAAYALAEWFSDDSKPKEGTSFKYNPEVNELFSSKQFVTGASIKGKQGDLQAIARPQAASYEMHVQLQVKCQDALKCVHITLRQMGRNIEARANWARHVMPPCDCGYNFDYGGYKETPLATCADGEGYGVSQLMLRYTVQNRHSIKNARPIAFSFENFLTPMFQTVLENVSLRNVQVVGAVLKGTWVPDTPWAKAQCVTRVVRVPLQLPGVALPQCLHAVLWQSNEGSGARIEEEGYNLTSLYIAHVKCWVDSKTPSGPLVQVAICYGTDVNLNDIRVGLNWLNDDGTWGGCITDKMPLPQDEYGKWIHATFSCNDMAVKLPLGIKNVYPIVFYAPGGNYDKAYFKTDLADAQYNNLVLELYGNTLKAIAHHGRDRRSNGREMQKIQYRRNTEIKAQALKEATHVYIDGNNFCFDNRGGVKTFIGIGRIDWLLSELKRPDVKAKIPNAEVKLFFDGCITRDHLPKFIERLNNGNVKICAGAADPEMMEEAKVNGLGTFIISADRFGEFHDYSVANVHRLLRPVIDNAVKIMELGVNFPFTSDHLAHLPLTALQQKRFPFGKEVTIKACCNRKYFCADMSDQSDVRHISANCTEASAWEKFFCILNDDGTVSFRSKANEKYVSAVVNGDGSLCAWVSEINDWEKFWLTRRKNRRFYALRSYANMKYVSVDPQVGLVFARADTANELEWLEITDCSCC